MKGFEIYSKPDCSWCVKLKELFVAHSLTFTEHSLGETCTKEDLQNRVGEHKKINTVPQLFVNDRYIGGYLEAVEFIAYDKHETVGE